MALICNFFAQSDMVAILKLTQGEKKLCSILWLTTYRDWKVKLELAQEIFIKKKWGQDPHKSSTVVRSRNPYRGKIDLQKFMTWSTFCSYKNIPTCKELKHLFE